LPLALAIVGSLANSFIAFGEALTGLVEEIRSKGAESIGVEGPQAWCALTASLMAFA
jgi:hypothetical protein